METQERGPTGWVGWVVFAAVMMIMLGVFSIIGGFIAIIDDSYTQYGNTAKNTWGWTTLILGVIILLAAFAMMQGRTWGRIVGVILTGLVAIDHFTTVRGYPVWDFLVI